MTTTETTALVGIYLPARLAEMLKTTTRLYDRPRYYSLRHSTENVQRLFEALHVLGRGADCHHVDPGVLRRRVFRRTLRCPARRGAVVARRILPVGGRARARNVARARARQLPGHSVRGTAASGGTGG